MKSPSFQFYPDTWLASQRVTLLTLEEEGAYIRLLGFCWLSGTIPACPEQCAKLVGKGCSTTVAEKVLKMFTPVANSDRMIHDRLELERQKQAEWREKSAIGGRKSGVIRSEQSLKGGSRVVQPNAKHLPTEYLNQKPTLPSSSPSPSSDKTHIEEACESPRLNGAKSEIFEQLKYEIAAIYQRPFKGCWSYSDEHKLYEIAKRPNVLDEWVELKTHRAELENPKYFPNSAYALMDGWDRTLDVSRTAKLSRQKTSDRPLSLFDMKTIIAAKETQAQDLKNRHCSEGPINNTWNSEESRLKFKALRAEIKEMTGKIASMG